MCYGLLFFHLSNRATTNDIDNLPPASVTCYLADCFILLSELPGLDSHCDPQADDELKGHPGGCSTDFGSTFDAAITSYLEAGISFLETNSSGEDMLLYARIESMMVV